MILHRRPKAPEHYVITIGSPWLINGEPTEATTASDALAEIYDQATWFPTWVDVITTDGTTYYLQMDAEGATDTRDAPVEEDTAAVPLAEEILDLPTDTDTQEDEAGSAAHAESELEDEREPAPRRPRRMTTPVKVCAAGLGLVVLLGMGGVAAYSAASDDESPAHSSDTQTQESAVALPEGATPLAISSRAVVALDGDQLLWLDPDNAEPVAEATTVKNPDKTRAMSTDALDVVADGTDQYVTYDGETKPEVHQGSANLRGEIPVVAEGQKVRVLGESQDDRTVPDKTAVFNGVSGGVAFARAPKDVIYPDHTVSLQGPNPKATISKWVQADTDRVVVVWKSTDKTILASHDPKTGKIAEESEVTDKEAVNVVAGVVRVGDNQYLNGDALTAICPDGEFIPGGLICPTEADHWETPSGAIATDKPAVIGANEYVTTNNEIKNLETK